MIERTIPNGSYIFYLLFQQVTLIMDLVDMEAMLVLEVTEVSEVMEVLEVFHAYCLPLPPLLKMLLPKTSTLDYPKTSQDYLKTTQDCLKTAQNFSRPPDPKLRRLFACVKT